MKIKTIINTLIVGSIFLIIYFFAGHDFVRFYFGGKTEIHETAEHINRLCNANGSCPETLEGWQIRGEGSGMMFKGNMIYFITQAEGSKAGDQSKKHQEFKLVYRFFLPDHWYEARGGVGMKVSSGWESR